MPQVKPATTGKPIFRTATGNADESQVNIDFFQHFQGVLPGNSHVFPINSAAAHGYHRIVQTAKLQGNAGAGGENIQVHITGDMMNGSEYTVFAAHEMSGKDAIVINLTDDLISRISVSYTVNDDIFTIPLSG